MIEQQIRACEVLDERLLSLYDAPRLWRENFVAAELRDLAYADMMLPLAGGQCMLTPMLEARMLQALELRGDERVLHIGCGSGFFAAMLGHLAGEVFSVEINAELAAAAAARLRAAGADKVSVVAADGAAGLAARAPYDAIVLTGALARDPDALFAQLTRSGRLLAVVGRAPAMHLRLFEKSAAGVMRRDILETDIPPLQNAPSGAAFEF